MYYKIQGTINDKVLTDLEKHYKQGSYLDYLVINSAGGDFEVAYKLVNLILDYQPLLPTIIEEKAFSAAAYIFLNMKNRYLIKGSSLYIHSIKINIYSPDSSLILQKRKKYTKILRDTVCSQFYVTLPVANKWLREGKAFTDEEISNFLSCTLIQKNISKYYEQFGSLSERFI